MTTKARLSNLADPGRTVRIPIDGKVDIETLPSLRDDLVETLDTAAEVILEVPGKEAPLPLLQLICAAHRSAADSGRALRVEWEQPQAVRELLRQLGLVRHVACSRSRAGDCPWREDLWG